MRLSWMRRRGALWGGWKRNLSRKWKGMIPFRFSDNRSFQVMENISDKLKKLVKFLPISITAERSLIFSSKNGIQNLAHKRSNFI